MKSNTSFSSAPAIFNGNDYAHWKVRMRAYLKGLNDNIWITVEKGFAKPNEDLINGVNMTRLRITGTIEV
jgi:hypothetical protein